MLMVGSFLPWSQAAGAGRAFDLTSAQVRFFGDGFFLGGGTLVHRNWVLAAAHLFADPNNVTAYSLRFGVVDGGNDANDSVRVRSIDRIVVGEGDIVMVHFADPVPEGTWLPRLATEAPGYLNLAMMFGWGRSGGRSLRIEAGIIYDPVATENAAFLRVQNPNFATNFPSGITPMVSVLPTVPGDSGAGVFSPPDTLVGIHSGISPYLHFNGSGNLYGTAYWASYHQPVWQYLRWIQDTINGVGSSGSSGEGAARRRLTEVATDAGLPMTVPPKGNLCAEGEVSCAVPEPKWMRGVLLGSGNNRGTVTAICAKVSGNSCSFNGAEYVVGTTGRMPLGTSKALESAGTREVMVWCRASNTFSEGASSRPVLRVSFTNAEREEVPVGYGWWDVMPDQVGTGNGTAVVDPARFATC